MKKLIASLALVAVVLGVWGLGGFDKYAGENATAQIVWNSIKNDVVITVIAADPLYLVSMDATLSIHQGQEENLGMIVGNRASTPVDVIVSVVSPLVGIYIPPTPYLLQANSETPLMVLIGAIFEAPAGPNTITVLIAPV